MEKDVESIKDTVNAAKYFWTEDQNQSLKNMLDLSDEIESLREKVQNLESILEREGELEEQRYD
jgi:hypothetical protein